MSINVHISIPWNLSPPGALGLKAFNHPWKFQLTFPFPPTVFIPAALSKFLVEQVKRSVQTSNYSCALLDGGSLASYCS